MDIVTDYLAFVKVVAAPQGRTAAGMTHVVLFNSRLLRPTDSWYNLYVTELLLIDVNPLKTKMLTAFRQIIHVFSWYSGEVGIP